MRLVIHDVGDAVFRQTCSGTPGQCVIAADGGETQSCIGCFGCWVKTPGKCVIPDSLQNTGALLGAADEIHVVSRCVYGGYSPAVKRALDRSISYLLPFFRVVNGETHHQRRYANRPRLRVYFYENGLSQKEKALANELVDANCMNFGIRDRQVSFHETARDALASLAGALSAGVEEAV